MNCTHCGTPLPSGALFCGECGRSVGSAPKPESTKASTAGSSGTRDSPAPTSQPRPSAPARWVEDPVTGTQLNDVTGDRNTVDDADDVDVDVEIDSGDVRCEQCDSIMGKDDIFCGECGFVSRAVTRAFTSDFTGETRQVDLSPPPARSTAPEPVLPPPLPEVTPEPEPEPRSRPRAEPAIEREELVFPEAPVRRAAPPMPPAPPAAPPRPQRSFLGDDAEGEDLEATRIVNRVSGNRFVLQFSTGESFTVHGAGLIGRNPTPEPGEFFDHLVRVLDSGKSVSKTHLEFGQEGGAFWLKDRFSGNGTVIREPDISARRAEPDRRYRVVRGTRIDIGEQFFVIS